MNNLPDFIFNPIQLTGKHVLLRPLKNEDKNGLLAAAKTIGQLAITNIPDDNSIAEYINNANIMQEQNGALVFVIINLQNNEIIGTTRYFNKLMDVRRIEIGYTFIAKQFQRTNINSECKFLLLQHAFENLLAIAVEFKTDALNFQSQKAILRIGAKFDGVIRKNFILKNGRIRDTFMYSILDSEWSQIKLYLASILKQS